MKKRKTYASRLTKEMLVKSGIESITEDGTVIRNGKQVIPTQDKNSGYLMLNLYDLDEDGNKIKMTVGLHRAMWAWLYGVVEEGKIVDHKNNKHTSIEDYKISNLQIITQRENTTKDRKASTKELKCKLDRPLAYYEDKLAYYEDLYQKAVKEGNQEEAHRRRANTYQQRAKIRYWLAHKEEAEALIAKKQACLETKLDSNVYHAKARVIKLLKANISKRRAEYNNALKANGSKHETTLSLKAEWKRARKELNDFEWAARGSDKSHLPELINTYTKRALLNL